MKAIELLIKMFEGFIKRAVMPSVSFGFIFIVEFLLFESSIDENTLSGIKNIFNSLVWNSINIMLLVIVLIGLSYFLSILNQLIFDNFIKKNYNTLCSKGETLQLEILRKKVIEKVKKKLDYIDNDTSDYFLYQIVSRELTYFKEPTDTRRYVDDTKSIGIFFLSLILVNMILFPTLWLIVLLVVGHYAIKAKYRSRAMRIYVNYLLGEEDKIKEEV